jgi:hypothetical protein
MTTTTRCSPEAFIGAAREVERLMRLNNQAYAVDITEQAGGNILVVVSFMDTHGNHFHVDQLGVIHR